MCLIQIPPLPDTHGWSLKVQPRKDGFSPWESEPRVQGIWAPGPVQQEKCLPPLHTGLLRKPRLGQANPAGVQLCHFRPVWSICSTSLSCSLDHQLLETRSSQGEWQECKKASDMMLEHIRPLPMWHSRWLSIGQSRSVAKPSVNGMESKLCQWWETQFGYMAKGMDLKNRGHNPIYQTSD